MNGAVKLWSFTEHPEAVRDYGPLTSQDGARSFEIATLRAAKDFFVATLRGVSSREDAARLNGVELYVARANLPPPEDGAYYHIDLIGLAAETRDGAPLGRVVAVHNFGAGDILEIAPLHGPTLLLPFTDAVAPVIDFAAGRVVIEVPSEIDGDAPES